MEKLAAARVVIIDNYDSFSYNLFQALGELTGEEARVFRNDRVSLAEVEACQPTHVVLSPGPGNPEEPSRFGVSMEVIRTLGARVPVLGVCLGHQGIAAAFGGRVVRAPEVRHGKTSLIHHDGSALFEGMPQPFEAMRYHSLVAERASVPAELEVTAWTEDGVVMALAHRTWPVLSVQFHPESVGTHSGTRLLGNFLRFAGPHPNPLPGGEGEKGTPARAS